MDNKTITLSLDTDYVEQRIQESAKHWISSALHNAISFPMCEDFVKQEVQKYVVKCVEPELLEGQYFSRIIKEKVEIIISDPNYIKQRVDAEVTRLIRRQGEEEFRKLLEIARERDISNG